MKIEQADLLISAVHPEQYPSNGLPEIAFVGRSNVGKSSFLNSLVNRKGLARTSSQPGKTQTLNFFQINETLNFVDVPGYGYAKVSKKQREAFGRMVEDYLSSRPTLRGVVSLVDARHQPTEDDQLMYDWLHYYEVPILVVGTKSDKVPSAKWNKSESQIKHTLSFDSNNSEFLLFSSETKRGVEEVWDWINRQIKNDA